MCKLRPPSLSVICVVRHSQCSIFGPTLFSIFINDIPHVVNISRIHLYVDDAILHATGPSPDAVIKTLLGNFLEIQQAFTKHHLD